MVIINLILAALLITTTPKPVQRCATMFITGYYPNPAAGFNSYTYDGTNAFTDEPIAAGPSWMPMSTYVTIENLGTYRIADRGYLGDNHIDVRVFSNSEAYAITSHREVCW